jgi:hypothetical protein
VTSRVLAPSASLRPLAAGAVGGALASLLSLAVALVLAAAQGQPPLAVPNAVGAWLVRWLQTAAPSALENFYPDATLGGLLLVVAGGGTAGAFVAAAAGHGPRRSGLALGLAAALLAWALLALAVAPALDAVLGAVLGPWGLAGTAAAWGLGMAWWLGGLRRAGGLP